MKRLQLTDAAWLLLENRERPMHVAGLQLFEYPPGAGPEFFAKLVDDFRSHDEVCAPFNQRLARPYGRAGVFHWIEDPHFDMEFHFRPLALPAPGSIRELLSLVSRVHSGLMDRHRPLWTCYLIDGIENNRFAIYTKIHHSVVDGVAAMRLAMRTFTPDPDLRGMLPPWAIPETIRRSTPSTLPLAGGATLNALAQVRLQVATLPRVSRALLDQFKKARETESEVVPYQAPRSLLNGRITGSRRFTAQSYSLPRMKSAAKATGSTINDIALAMCASALRQYLLDLGELPDKPLIAMVPVSVRPADEPGYGNSIGFIMCNLATHLAHAGERLTLIRESMRANKARLHEMTRQEIINYSLLITGPLVLGQLLGIEGRARPMFNVTISNVPGPKEPLYLNGARLTGMYPVSLLPDGQAINITLMSYVDSMEFGITACRKTLPSVQRLIDYLEQALVDLESLSETATSRRKAVTRRKAK